MPILISAVYVWALYALVLGLGGLHLSRGFAFLVGPGVGVAYALGLARLAQRYSPKQLAVGSVILNPGWAWLLSLVICAYAPPIHEIRMNPPLAGCYDPSGESQVLVPVLAVVGISLGIYATSLSLGLVSGLIQGGSSRIVQAAVISAFWGIGVPTVLNVWTPTLAASYAFLILGLVGIAWVLTHEETKGRMAEG